MRLRTALLTSMLMCLLVPEAGAQRAVTVSLDGLQDGAVVGGTMPLSVHASATAGIRKLTMWVDNDVVLDQSPNSVKQEVDADYDWDTRHYVASPGLSRNRKYTVRVRAAANGGGEDEVTITAVVNNAPARPTGLSSQVIGKSVTLSWEANPEPDITGYRVERFYGNDYVAVETLTETTFTESRSPGRYSYRLVALRHSEVAPNGVESVPTSPVTAMVSAAPGTTGSGAGGAGGAGGSSKRGDGIVSGGNVGAIGLPDGADLPGSRGLGGAPELPAAEWGSFKKRLPYKLPKGGVPLSAKAVSKSSGPFRIIPPDGLRWVAMGLLLLTLAGLTRLLALRITLHPEPAKIEA